MAEVLDQEKQETAVPETETQAPAQAPSKAGFSEAGEAPKKRKKNKKKIVRRIVALVIVAALIGGGVFAWKKLGKKETPEEVLTEMVGRGSITSIVEGSGAAMAKDSASVTLLSTGQVLDIYVSEGDYVNEGDELYSIESKDAQNRVNSEQKNVNNLRKQLNKLYEAAKDLNVRADYDGILIVDESQKKLCAVGEKIPNGTTVATLVDNTKFLLPLYFSYAYENDIYVGQSVTVSVPVTMAQLPGTVHEIHKVQYVTSEGGKMFQAIIAVDNPGTLTEKMTATATLYNNGETIYPYEPGELEWFRSKTLRTEITGDCAWNNLYNYLPVKAGESILTLTADSNDDEISAQETQLRSAEKQLEEAQKNLESLNGTAPIDGTVLTIGLSQGQEAKTGTVAVSIADLSTMKIETQVDEMYVGFIKAGMPVDLKLGETAMIGTVESVSLSAKSENGVARFPITIIVDNSEGLLRSGAYVDYSFTASQSEDCLLVPIQCVKSAQTVDGETCKILFVQSDVPLESEVELDLSMMTIPAGFQPVYVEVGISDNRNTEIISGVEEGMIVYSGVMSSDNMGMMF